jgi:DNA sulfur modification protein DndB
VQEDCKKPQEKRELKDDQFSVILVAHIDDEPGRKKTRKLFSDINKYAKPVAEGDKIKIDEEDLCAIVTRRIYANLSYFKKGKLISLTETAKLDPNDDVYFTNLLALYRVNKKLRQLFKKTRGTDEWEEENVSRFQKIVEDFYGFAFKNIKEYKDYFIEKSLTLKTARKDSKYLLFRPVGLVLIARLYAHFRKINQFEVLKKNINKVRFVMPNSPYNKVLWDQGKMEAKISSQTIAFNLTRYLLNEYPKGDVPNLLKKYREITKNDDAELPVKII